MASWCAICSRKLDEKYLYHRGRKVHKACLKARKSLAALDRWIKTEQGDK